MRSVPGAALWLGLAGLLPFLWGVAGQFHAPLSEWGLAAFGPRFVGAYVGLAYGTVILSFMSGVLWGFATKAGDSAGLAYGLSVIPALWAFFTVGGGPQIAAINLMIGFAGLLGLDFLFWQWGLAPRWWMKLRVVLTTVVLACLSVTALDLA